MYTSLNDAAIHANALLAGNTKIWYYKPAVSRWAGFGELNIDRDNLEVTHVLLGSVAETDLDIIFGIMQGEVWSPEGEARELIRSKELSHTSMSIGDLIEVNGRVYEVRPIGFVELV